MSEWNFFSVVQQLLVILSIVSQIYVVTIIISQSKGSEKFVRATAISAGVLIFLGSKAFNLTFADLFLFSLNSENIIQISIAGVVTPILIGILVAHETIFAIASGSNFAIRVLLLVGVFILAQMSYLNYVALYQASLPIDKALLPNLLYSLAVSLWIVFRYNETEQFSKKISKKT